MEPVDAFASSRHLQFNEEGEADLENWDPGEFHQGSAPYKAVHLGSGPIREKRKESVTYKKAMRLLEQVCHKLGLQEDELRNKYDEMLKRHVRHYVEILVAVVVDHIRQKGDKKASIGGVLSKLEFPVSMTLEVGKQLKRLAKQKVAIVAEMKSSEVMEEEESDTSPVEDVPSYRGPSFQFDPFASHKLPLSKEEMDNLRHLYTDLHTFFSRNIGSATTQLPPFCIAVALIAWDCFKGFFELYGRGAKKPKASIYEEYLKLLAIDDTVAAVASIKRWYNRLQKLLVERMKEVGLFREKDFDYPTAVFHHKEIVKYSLVDVNVEKYHHVCKKCQTAKKSNKELKFSCFNPRCYYRKPTVEPSPKVLPPEAFSTELNENDLSAAEWKEISIRPDEAFLRFVVEEIGPPKADQSQNNQ